MTIRVTKTKKIGSSQFRKMEMTSYFGRSFRGLSLEMGKIYIYYYRHGTLLCTDGPGNPCSRFLVMSRAFEHAVCPARRRCDLHRS